MRRIEATYIGIIRRDIKNSHNVHCDENNGLLVHSNDKIQNKNYCVVSPQDMHSFKNIVSRSKSGYTTCLYLCLTRSRLILENHYFFCTDSFSINKLVCLSTVVFNTLVSRLFCFGSRKELVLEDRSDASSFVFYYLVYRR